MKPLLNPAVDGLSIPPIPEVQAWARAYDGSHGPLIDMSQAVPGYSPHPNMLKWLGEAASSTQSAGYGAIPGEPSLRHAYANHVSELYDCEIVADETLITAGCNQAFIAAAMAIAGAGDAILMTNPGYFNHQTTLSILGIETRYVDCDPRKQFLPDIGEVKQALNGVKVLALVSPNNPTGSIYPPELLNAIFDAGIEAGVWLILDETYRDFMECESRHRLFAKDNWRENLILLYSFSKSFCIPGHRLGAVIASQTVIGGITKVMDNMQICAPRAAQQAVAKAIEPLKDWREANRLEIQKRASALEEVISHLPGWEIAAMGAYFAYVRHPFDNLKSSTVAERLAREAGVSCLPGAFFGDDQEQYLRIAFANADVEIIRQLHPRLADFTRNLDPLCTQKE